MRWNGRIQVVVECRLGMSVQFKTWFAFAKTSVNLIQPEVSKISMHKDVGYMKCYTDVGEVLEGSKIDAKQYEIQRLQSDDTISK